VKYLLRAFIIINYSLLVINSVSAKFTRQDTLRGSNGPGRDWWDVMTYNIYIEPDYKTKTIKGWNEIGFNVLLPGKNKIMQIDLQQPLAIESITLDNKKIQKIKREGNVYWIDFSEINFTASYFKENLPPPPAKPRKLKISFYGKPIEAKRPPWDGGWIWAKDAEGRPWMSVACQGLGASVWFPCKDFQGDEPDQGAILQIDVPDSLTAIANGKLFFQKSNNPQRMLYAWRVKSPINNYNLIPYIGKYTSWEETLPGEKAYLQCDYRVLDYNLEKAKEQFKQAAMTLKAFEHWFGPYPFYQDGFKLVEAPHLGMEHQSAVAYGNGFQNGYRGRDLSGTGWGLKWDFIIVHEVGHEWFGNNITTKDIADMWVHEGFTNYSETLFTDYHFGKEAGNDYCIGTRRLIENDKPIIGTYEVNKRGSGDMYYKGGNMIHTIRQLINDDEKFRQILRGLNNDFYHQTVTTQDIEKYLSEKSGINLSKVFDQYLRTTKIPVLEYKISGSSVSYRWSNCIEGFDMRVKLTDGAWLEPAAQWKEMPLKENMKNRIEADRNFYITVKQVK
jgi:aminopeptidase N